MSIRRIVVAVDASEPARRAAERAASLAGHLQAELRLVHVYEPVPDELASVLTANRLDEQSRTAAERMVTTLTETLGERAIDTLAVPGRDVPSTVCKVARDSDADLVVVGSLGRTGVRRVLLGSVAAQVVRRAHCAVWVERPLEPVVREVERLIVCTDLSPLSEAGLALASDLATDLGITVEIVHALEHPYREVSTEVNRKLVAKRKQRLTELAAKHFEGFVPRITVVQGSDVVDAVNVHAARTSADLVVLATHGRTGLSRVFMGSVAERVTRFAPCSVLVARSPVDSA